MDLRGAAKLLLLLASLERPGGALRLSNRETAASLGCAVRTVQRWRAKLREAGVVGEDGRLAEAYRPKRVAAAGRFTRVPVGRLAVVPPADVRVWIAALATTTPKGVQLAYQRTIARFAGVARATVVRAVRSLRRLGIRVAVRMRRRRGGVTEMSLGG